MVAEIVNERCGGCNQLLKIRKICEANNEADFPENKKARDEAAASKKKAEDEDAAARREASLRKAEAEQKKKEQDAIEQSISSALDQVQKNCAKQGEGCQDNVNNLLTGANTLKSKFGGAAGKK